MASAVPRPISKVIPKQPTGRPSLVSKANEGRHRLRLDSSSSSSDLKSAHLDPEQKIERSKGRSIRASFWRGGTSKGVFIPWKSLPNSVYPLHLLHQQRRLQFRWEDHPAGLQPFLNAIFGSPDHYGRQLNGIGGGISSLSKAILYKEAFDDKEADVEYTFIQVGVEDGELDLTGNCGNLTSVVGPLALNERLVVPSLDRFDYSKAVKVLGDAARRISIPVTIRLRNTNTGKLIHANLMATVPMSSGSYNWQFQPAGRYAIDGVPGTGSKISLKFLSPGGSKTGKVLPTGRAVDTLKTDHDSIRASLVDITNPGIFISGADVGWEASRTPEELNANTGLLARLEAIRKKGTELMGLDPLKYKATPKIVLVYPAATDTAHIRCQALSMEKAHKAVPGTLALNLGAACKIPGTLPYQLVRRDSKSEVVIGHPSGNAEVGAEVGSNNMPNWVELGRTARCIMEGFVNTRPDHMEDFEEQAVEIDSPSPAFAAWIPPSKACYEV